MDDHMSTGPETILAAVAIESRQSTPNRVTTTGPRGGDGGTE